MAISNATNVAGQLLIRSSYIMWLKNIGCLFTNAKAFFCVDKGSDLPLKTYLKAKNAYSWTEFLDWNSLGDYFMKAFFEVKELTADWKPPFSKRIEVHQHEVEEDDTFEHTAPTKANAFRLLKVKGDSALIEYDQNYSVKGYEQPMKRRLWVAKGQEISFCFLWSDKGITKTLRLVKTATSEFDLPDRKVEDENVAKEASDAGVDHNTEVTPAKHEETAEVTAEPAESTESTVSSETSSSDEITDAA